MSRGLSLYRPLPQEAGLHHATQPSLAGGAEERAKASHVQADDPEDPCHSHIVSATFVEKLQLASIFSSVIP